MHLGKTAIEKLDRITRLKLINSVTGIKSANLIGTIDNNGNTNLAVFSSVVHLGSDPALIGFISRPQIEDVGHTFANIVATEYYTINHIHPDFVRNAHYTSAKFGQEISEFKECGLTEQYIKSFKAPFVKESSFKMGLRFRQKIDLTINDTIIVIGEIMELLLPEKINLEEEINLESTNSVGISGLNTYYSLSKLVEHPYVRLHEVPTF